MPKHITIINLACTITKLRKWGQAWKHSAESAQNAASRLTAEHERKLAEHRAAFGARTEADRRIIEGLRAIMAERGLEAFEAGSVLGCVGDESPMQAARRVVKERDGLLTQVKDQRAEIERLQWENQTMHKDAEDGYAEAIKVLGDPIALSKERDALRAEVAALKHEVDTLSCPYVSGQRVRVKSEGGLITQQSEYGIGKIGIINAFAFVARIGSRGWVDVQDIEPCDLPVDHDTPAGKEAAEAVIRDSQMTAIKVGDVVEVFQASGNMTFKTDIGAGGIVKSIVPASKELHAHAMIESNGNLRLPAGRSVSLCDVRKVPH